jgi:hypothetical protein
MLEELKRLITAVPQMRISTNWRQVFVLTRYDLEKNECTEWFPNNPFAEDFPWQGYQAG